MADNTQEDLSMEDILSSIKNILVEDAQQQDDSAATPATPPVVENIADISISSLADDIALSEEDDVFDLSAHMRVDDVATDDMDVNIPSLVSDEDSQIQSSDFADDDPLDLSEVITDTETNEDASLDTIITTDVEAEPFYADDDNISHITESVDDLNADTSIEAEIVAETVISEPDFAVATDAGATEPMFEVEAAQTFEPIFEEVQEPDVYEEEPIPTPVAAEPDASDNMLSNFAQMFTPTSPKASSLGDGSKTLETLVKEVIADEVSSYVAQNLENLATHDMIMAETSRQISAWVDNNLQKVVEDIVRQEIVRVMAKVGNN